MIKLFSIKVIFLILIKQSYRKPPTMLTIEPHMVIIAACYIYLLYISYPIHKWSFRHPRTSTTSLGGGGIPKSQGRGWRFDSWLQNLLSTWQKELTRLSTASCALTLACQPSISTKQQQQQQLHLIKSYTYSKLIYRTVLIRIVSDTKYLIHIV
jgi:hypothetical protein